MKLEPERWGAHYSLGSAYLMSGDHLRASECFLSAMERCEPDSESWACDPSVIQAHSARRTAAPCGFNNIFCDCQRCAVLPEKPAWIASPEAVVATADRVVVVAVIPEEPTACEMHGNAHLRHRLVHSVEKLHEGCEILRRERKCEG
jgi:hypothetical protein